jgi:hypothetical protein
VNEFSSVRWFALGLTTGVFQIVHSSRKQGKGVCCIQFRRDSKTTSQTDAALQKEIPGDRKTSQISAETLEQVLDFPQDMMAVDSGQLHWTLQGRVAPRTHPHCTAVGV